jgi:hypothetical protein
MKKLLINWGLKSLNTLIEVSIKDSVVLLIVQLLIGMIVKIIDILTDDDKDNSTQIKAMLKEELDVFIIALTKGKEELNK